MPNETQPTSPDIINVKTTLPPLPFVYERTNNPGQADYKEWRVSPVIIGGRRDKPRTDEEIAERVKEQRKDREWFTSDYWREKGIPVEQIEFTINGRRVAIYNYCEEKLFTDGHVTGMTRVFEEFASRFPQILQQISWVLINNNQLPSAFGDPDKYPTNGMANPYDRREFRLFPRGMELFPFRIPSVSNFEGVLTHELTHLIQDEFQEEWLEKFQWQFCIDHPDWEWKTTPDGASTRLFHKKTGEMAPNSAFPLQPDSCVTDYAKIDWNEDVCESMVAYIYDPKLLKRIAPDKFDILQNHDARRPKPNISAQRVPKDQIKLPEIKQETVYYYIEENAGKMMGRK